MKTGHVQPPQEGPVPAEPNMHQGGKTMEEHTGIHQPSLEEVRNNPTAEGLHSLDDASLHHVMGHTHEVAQAREHLQNIMSLKGRARQIADGKIKEMFKPNVSGHSFRYAHEDSVRQASDEAKQKSGKAAYENASPASVLS